MYKRQEEILYPAMEDRELDIIVGKGPSARSIRIELMKDGIIDCIVVKDLSRFAREYIDAGRYIERMFPAMGIRFIAINDAYDSADTQAQGNEIIIPFKNLINDAYCRDISIKIRSHLAVSYTHLISWYIRDGKYPYMVGEDAEKFRKLCEESGEFALKKFAEMTPILPYLTVWLLFQLSNPIKLCIISFLQA